MNDDDTKLPVNLLQLLVNQWIHLLTCACWIGYRKQQSENNSVSQTGGRRRRQRDRIRSRIKVFYPPAGSAPGSPEMDLQDLHFAAVPTFCPSSPAEREESAGLDQWFD